jgi:hypothetical protein
VVDPHGAPMDVQRGRRVQMERRDAASLAEQTRNYETTITGWSPTQNATPVDDREATVWSSPSQYCRVERSQRYKTSVV